MDSLGDSFERKRLECFPVGGFELCPGYRIRLQPSARADVLDLTLRGKTAAIESIEQDLEGRVYLTVSVDDDPGRDLGAAGIPGHRFFFGPEEVEPLGSTEDGA
jgi:hydrogenase maturation protease